MKLAIIDTKCANLASLKFALDRLGLKSTISSDLRELEMADKLFLPGVGTAARAMQSLRELNLSDFLRRTKKPTLGICLGMQILGAFSEELNQQTLGIMSFAVKKFTPRQDFTLPHMGWNAVQISRQNALFSGLEGAFFYFVHSFCVKMGEFEGENFGENSDKFTAGSEFDGAKNGEKSVNFGENSSEKFVAGREFDGSKNGEKSSEKSLNLSENSSEKSANLDKFGGENSAVLSKFSGENSSEICLAKCTYSEDFAAAVQKDNFYGVQFHPERSGEAGEILLKNFVWI